MKRVLKYLIDFLKGLIIGISNIIPGFSGGTMAVIVNEYERIINSFSEIVHHPIKVLKDIWALAIGLAIGVIITSFTIVLALKKYPYPTVMLFVGLVLGSVPMVLKNIKKESEKKYQKLKIEVKDVIAFIVCFGIIISMPFLNVREASNSLDFLSIIMILLTGLISAGAMIVPGLSGTLIMMVMGYYFLVINNIKDAVSGILTFHFEGIGLSVLVLLIFAIGALVGLLSIAKLINYLFKKFPKCVYVAILGFLLASPFSMILSTNKAYPDDNFGKLSTYIFAFLAFATGVSVILLMTHIQEERKPKTIEEREKEGLPKIKARMKNEEDN